MPVDYAAEIKSARMEVVATALEGGTCVVMSDSARELAVVPLRSVSVSNGMLTIETPIEARATARGRVATVQLRASNGRAIIRNLRHKVDVLLDADWLIEGQSVRIIEARIIHG